MQTENTHTRSSGDRQRHLSGTIPPPTLQVNTESVNFLNMEGEKRKL